jgi:hypothetical protein
VKKPDHGHRRLLRKRRERPRGSRAAEKRDEVAALHVSNIGDTMFYTVWESKSLG